MRLLKTSTDLNVVLQSFTNLLKDSLSPLCDRLSQCGKLDLEMIDWILLVFNELLQHFGKNLLHKNRSFITARTNFVNKGSGYRKDKRFTFLKNRFHTFKCTQSNQNKQKRGSILVGCTKDVRSIHEAVTFFCLTLRSHDSRTFWKR